MVRKLETEGAVIVACGCRKYPIKAEAVRKPAKNHKTKKVEQTEEHVQYRATTNKTTQKTMEAPVKMVKKWPDERHKDVPIFSEGGEVSLFKNRNF